MVPDLPNYLGVSLEVENQSEVRIIIRIRNVLFHRKACLHYGNSDLII